MQWVPCMTMGQGASNIARQLGAKQYDQASIYVSTSKYTEFLFRVVIMVLGLLYT